FYEFVPGIKSFRGPSMMLFWLSMALFLLSAEALRRLTAEGADRLPDAVREKIRRNLVRAGWISAGVLAAASLAPGLAYSVWNAFVDPGQIPNISRQQAAEGAFTLGGLRVAALTALLTFAAGTYLLRARRMAAFGLA